MRASTSAAGFELLAVGRPIAVLAVATPATTTRPTSSHFVFMCLLRSLTFPPYRLMLNGEGKDVMIQPPSLKFVAELIVIQLVRSIVYCHGVPPDGPYGIA